MTSRHDLDLSLTKAHRGMRTHVIENNRGETMRCLGAIEGLEIGIEVADALSAETTRLQRRMVSDLAHCLGREGATDWPWLLREVQRLPRRAEPRSTAREQKKGSGFKRPVQLPFRVPDADASPVPSDSPLPLAVRDEALTPEQAKQRVHWALEAFEDHKDELKLALEIGGIAAAVVGLFG